MSGFWILSPEIWILNPELWIQNSEPLIMIANFRTQNIDFKTPMFEHIKHGAHKGPDTIGYSRRPIWGRREIPICWMIRTLARSRHGDWPPCPHVTSTRLPHSQQAVGECSSMPWCVRNRFCVHRGARNRFRVHKRNRFGILASRT